jgi:FKBP-type peptidyl-prolyl cis-trans isomerase SlyD
MRKYSACIVFLSIVFLGNIGFFSVALAETTPAPAAGTPSESEQSGASLVNPTASEKEHKSKEKNMSVINGSVVSLEYKLTDDAGAEIDSNVGSEPLVYTQGGQQIVPGLEKEISGMKVGESKQVTVKPEEGYGEVNDQAFVEVPLEKIPEGARKVGAQLQTQDPSGQLLLPVVTKVSDTMVTLNFNHPLAGKTLHFDIKILGIDEPASGQE